MKPVILIEDDVYRKVMHWVNKSQFEVSGLGMVKVEKDGVLRVVSAMLLPQKNGSTHTDIEADDVGKALFKLKDSEGDLRWWWHSHVQMGVFWSGTDKKTIEDIGKGGWFAATVFNQKKEVKSCYYGAEGIITNTPWGPKIEPLLIDDLTTKVTLIENDETKAWDKEYDDNVTVSRFHTPNYGHGGSYIDRGNGQVSSTTTSSTAGSADVVAFKDWHDPKVAPPLNRPIGMSKKAFKKWNSDHVAHVAALKAIAEFEADRSKVTQLPLPPPRPPETEEPRPAALSDVDMYGFNQEERTLLSMEGWCLKDIDDMVDADFTPHQVLRIARLGLSFSEVDYLLTFQDYDVEDVMVLVSQSESFGQNLFENPKYFRTGESV